MEPRFSTSDFIALLDGGAKLLGFEVGERRMEFDVPPDVRDGAWFKFKNLEERVVRSAT